MTFNRTFRTIAGVAAVAVATAFGAGVAFAQPHGHHGHGGGDDVMIGQLIAHAKDKLSLNTMQQQQFDTAAAHSNAAWQSGRALHDNVKATLQAELAKPQGRWKARHRPRTLNGATRRPGPLVSASFG